MALKELLGVAVIVLNIFLQVSPMPSMIEGVKARQIKSMTISYFIVGITQGLFWIAYGIKIKDIVVYGQNITCYLLFSIYMNMIIYVRQEKKLYLLTNIPLCMLLLLAIFYVPTKFCVVIGSIITICWQSTNIENIRNVLASKDAGFINPLVSWVSWVCFCCYWNYCLLIFDYIMFIPYFIAWVINSINLFAYFWANGKISNDNVIIKLIMKCFCVEYNGGGLLDSIGDKDAKFYIDLDSGTTNLPNASAKENFLKNMDRLNN